MEKQNLPKRSRGASVKRAGLTVAVLALGLALAVALFGAAVGRYQRQFDSDNSVKALAFYFESDLLDGQEHTLAPGSKELTFTLSNHADELRFSEVEITCAVTVTKEDGTAATVAFSGDKSKLAKNEKDNTTVTISNLQPGKYTITATGTGGYVKTLSATIVIPELEAQLYQHLDTTSDYLLLTVWNEGEENGTVTIEYTGIPDNTNPNMTDWGTDGTVTDISIPAHSSKVFRFFGDNASVTVTGADKGELK